LSGGHHRILWATPQVKLGGASLCAQFPLNLAKRHSLLFIIQTNNYSSLSDKICVAGELLQDLHHSVFSESAYI
jgi:hypothetical protein